MVGSVTKVGLFIEVKMGVQVYELISIESQFGFLNKPPKFKT